jgi:hypothetical protein
MAGRIGQTIVLRVRDTGLGLPPDELAHIFERFAQVRPAKGRDSGSTAHRAADCGPAQGPHRSPQRGPVARQRIIVTLPSKARADA